VGAFSVEDFENVSAGFGIWTYSEVGEI